jgi:hypothetical protein
MLDYILKRSARSAFTEPRLGFWRTGSLPSLCLTRDSTSYNKSRAAKCVPAWPSFYLFLSATCIPVNDFLYTSQSILRKFVSKPIATKKVYKIFKS